VVGARREGEERSGCLLELAEPVSNHNVASFSTSEGWRCKSEQGKEGDELKAE
jgi:hypothetical protein